ncbi:tripartite ATP-independent transporter solute receptor, DctP family [Collimonas sp. OK607]|uniref:TRAP transporter substrate-binding protein n=1 Tax=Collimonas sp. OK607 TaxID=1798194 RepID=UPI0008F363D6|nr:TRAP transporter substrate-binding protein [Collimonas sp. OK607]SFB20992.1 tripartite ATP-independent transporter solute receptor, DctP family [Collimonas sp. OK607]
MSDKIIKAYAEEFTDERRRSVLKTFAGVAVAAAVPTALMSPGFSQAAEPGKFRLKLGISLADSHPISSGLRAACADILKESNGRLNIELFANGQLGSDTDMISQVRSGGIDMLSTAGTVWGTLVQATSINAVAFAFPDYATVWKALDGDLGAHVRSQFAKFNLVPQTKIWDHGFRHVTNSSKPLNVPADIAGMKVRVPMAPILVSLFRALGAAPASINYAELYTALQTHIVDGQENPLNVVDTAKLYEVQKYCSLTAHAWDGFWLAANKRSWESLPADLRQLASRIFDAHADKQRTTNAAVNTGLIETLKGRGMAFNQVDGKLFRQAIQKTGYYDDMRKRFGPEIWGLLEKHVGKLV